MAIIDVTDNHELVIQLINNTKPVDIHWGTLGITSVHNMPCPVYPDDSIAIHNGNTGVYHPCDKAKDEGWRLRRIRVGREWLFNLLEGLIFYDRFTPGPSSEELRRIEREKLMGGVL